MNVVRARCRRLAGIAAFAALAAALSPSAVAMTRGPSAAAASPPPASPGTVRADESFRGGRLHTWTAGQRRLHIVRGRNGRGELVTPRSSRPMVVVRQLGAAMTVDLRFSFQRRGGGAQTLALLQRNGVALRLSRHGAVALCPRAGHRCLALGRAHRRWQRVRLALDVASGAISAQLGRGRTRRLLAAFAPESEVRVGDVGHEVGGPIAFRDLRLRALLAPAPVPPPPAAPPPVAPATAPAAGVSLFAPESVWRAPLADNTPIDPQSAAITGAVRAEIAREVAAHTGPWIATTSYSTPIYTVEPSQPNVRVKLDSYEPALQRAFASVPLPDNASPASGTDACLTVYQPSTDSLWEFWKLRWAADGWHAAWGGAIQHVSQSPGYYSSSSWPGAASNWGASATSLPLVAGTMRLAELQAGRIDHALALAVPDARAGQFAFPAQRSDGTSADPLAIPEGARLRLDPQLNIDALNLPPVARAMALAAQRYGIIVRDKTYGATVFYAEDPTPTGGNPYPALFGMPPNFLLARFPWDHLQLVKMQLTSTS